MYYLFNSSDSKNEKVLRCCLLNLDECLIILFNSYFIFILSLGIYVAQGVSRRPMYVYTMVTNSPVWSVVRGYD